MRYTDKSELLLKYQKTKAKLIEYDVPNDSYPNFPINSNDLSFSTVYILSRYAESIIENDVELQAEFRPHLVKAAQYYDAAFESKERLQHDQNFLITGAVAYFLYNDFGSAKVLSSKLKFSLPIVNSPFQLLIVCLRYLLTSKTQLFESDTSYCTNIYKSLLTYFHSGNDDGSTISWLSKYRQYTFNAGNALDVFYVDLLYAVVVFAMQKSAWSLLPQYSGITVDVWRSYLERREAVKILWQSQELLCTYGVLQGKNAIVQLPTGVGKTKSIELIIRAAQLSNRTREVIIVAPLRALCNEITHELQCAFRKDGVEINQFSDVLEDDYSFDLLSNDGIRISICTPEKLNYIIHHQPDICDMVGLFVLDEAHIADEAYQYVMKRRELEGQMTQATQQIVTLRTFERSSSQICATQSGYITDVHVTAGQSWDGRSAALTMSATDATILLRADSANASRAISEGAVVNISGRYGSTVKTSVNAVGYDSMGNPYIDAIVQQRDMTSLDTPANLMSKGITLRINYTAGSSTYLLPASAVRGSGDQRSVYTLKEVENSFGQITLIVEEQPVTVLDESGDTVAVTGVPDHAKIAYMEDRAIGPGSEVMAYD